MDYEFDGTPDRTPEEIEENERLKEQLAAYAGRREWRPEDRIEAAAQLFARSYGLRSKEPMHPLAQSLPSKDQFGVVALAEQVLHARGRPMPEAGGDGFGLVVNALSTADFPSIVETTIRGTAAERKTPLLDSLVALTHQREAANYRPQSYSTADLSGLPAPSAGTMADYRAANVILTGEQVQVYSLFAQILVSRQALVNDDRNFINSAIAAFLSVAHRNELKTFVALTEANANLSDGSPLFGAGTSNEITAALDAAGLGTAFSALRSQPTESGDATDAKAHALLVHSDDEVAALGLVEALPEDRRPMVIATSYLSDATDWFLLADPEVFPVIGRTRMEGSPLNAVSFSPLEAATFRDETGTVREYNGLALPARHTVGYSVLSRIGAVKIQKS